jgi:hypothetical protein
MKVIKPFLKNLKIFYFYQVNNMLTLMLNPCFKFLWVVESFVGHGNAIHLATKYDEKKNQPPYNDSF